MRTFRQWLKPSKKECARTVLKQAYRGHRSFQTARAARIELGREHDPSLLYGEILFDSFWDLLQSLPTVLPGAFIDLGCGSGKAALTALFTDRFSNVVGIDCLAPLIAIAHSAHKQAIEHKTCPPMIKAKGEQSCFEVGDWLQTSLLDGSVVLINGTGLFDQAFDALIDRCQCLPNGAWVLVISRRTERLFLEAIAQRLVAMSWGEARVNIYCKV